MTPQHRLLLPTTRGAEQALVDELDHIGIHGAVADRGVVRLQAPIEAAYRALLWSRVASRVLVCLGDFHAPMAEDLYRGAGTIPWEDHVDPKKTLMVEVVGGSETIRHSVYAAQRVKDAICDRLRDRVGARPDIDLRRPDLRVHVHLRNDRATISLDLAGEGLHLRGAGRDTGRAPMKETLAAALLWMTGWPRHPSTPLVDPMCGAGTLLTEAAAMGLDLAPGLLRPRWGFAGWRQHEPRIWDRLMNEARERRTAGRGRPLALFGADASDHMIDVATGNAKALGLEGAIRWARRGVEEARPPAGVEPGIVVTNPPYGERLGETAELFSLYAELGDRLRQRFLGWTAFVITAHGPLVPALGLKPRRRHVIHNGPIECRWLEIPISSAAPQSDGPGWRRE